MKLLLLYVLLLIQPVSNEQIQLNMGFLREEIVYVQEYKPFSPPAKAPWRQETYTAIANDGTVFVVKYYTIAFSVAVNVLDDGGLGLDSWYLTRNTLIAAINDAVQEYNFSVPIGEPICLLPLGLLYLAKRNKKQKWQLGLIH